MVRFRPVFLPLIDLEPLEQIARKQKAVTHEYGDDAIERRNERNQMKRHDHTQNEDDKRRPERKLFRRIESHNQKSSFYHP